MWLFFVALLLIAFIVFWRLNCSLYSKKYGGSLGVLYKGVIDSYCSITRSLFALFPNFSNYTWSMIRKFVALSIIIILYHYVDIHWLFYIYLITYAISFAKFMARKGEFKKMDDNNKPFFEDLYTASRRLMIFNTMYCLIYLTFICVENL